MRTWLTAVAFMGTVLCGPAGCQRATGASGPTDGRLRIVCTIGMITDVVRAVAGDRARVTGLIGTGVDPHLYKPTRNDIVALQAADIIFYNGLMLEGKMGHALARLSRSDRPVVAVTEQLPAGYLLHPDGPGGHPDPHVWMDVAAWRSAVGVIADTLSRCDPGNAAAYAENAHAYQLELDALDAYARRTIGSIPRPRRVLITAHDAFNYFGCAYDMEVLGIQGLSTESEAGLNDITRLVDFIVSRDLRAIFVESSVAQRNVRALIEGAGARGTRVAIGGELFSDAMGAAGTYEGTYIGMIDHNATTIARALGGEAPPRGFLGKLTPPDDTP